MNNVLDTIKNAHLNTLPDLRSRLMVSDGDEDLKEEAIKAIDERLSPKRHKAAVIDGELTMGDITDMSVY